MSERNIEVLVRLEEEDYRLFYREIMRSKVVNVAIAIIILALVMEGIYIALGLITIEDMWSQDKLELVFIAVFIIYIIGKKIVLKIILKREFSSNKLLQKESRYCFTDSNIKITCTDGSGEMYVNWDELHSAKQTKEIFILLTSKYSGLIIPKRLMTNEQVKLLEELVSNKLGVSAFPKDKAAPWIYGIVGVLILIYLLASILLLYYTCETGGFAA